MLFRIMMVMLIALCGVAAHAQERVQERGQEADVAVPQTKVAAASAVAKLIKSMPAKRLKALRATPDGFLDDAASMIYAYGTDGQIDQAGLEAYVTLRRAVARARNIGFFLTADLNNDGAISRAEATLYAGTLTASRRGDLYWGFDLADADADGSATMDELRSHADGVAMKAMDETDAAGVRSLILFDLNGNGAVAIDEVVTAVSSLVTSE